MGWDRKQRGSSSGYYYRSVRRNGKPVKIYLGRGPEAEQAAAGVERARQARQAAQAAVAAEHLRLAGADACLAEVHRVVKLLFRAVLFSSGYYYLHKGTWRRRGHGTADEG